jgi:hypothetical protein
LFFWGGAGGGGGILAPTPRLTMFFGRIYYPCSVQPNWRRRFGLAKVVGYKQDMKFFLKKKGGEKASSFFILLAISWIKLLKYGDNS